MLRPKATPASSRARKPAGWDMARARGAIRNYRRAARHKGKRLRERRDRLSLRLRSIPIVWEDEGTVENPNTLFSSRLCRQLHGRVQRAVHRNPELLRQLADSRIQGLRCWEYGVLLAVLERFSERSGWSALDVGSGGSPFPRYLLETGNVGSMTTLDLPDPFERRSRRNRARDAQSGVVRVHGSMLDLSFEDETFDLVTCISAIEHLDGDPLAHRRDPAAHGQAAYGDFLSDSRRALAGLMAVVKPGGYLYLTTDVYVPELQGTDAWSPPEGVPRIWSAYRFEEIDRLFVDALLRDGFRFVGEPDYRRELLERDEDRSTFRGRYFTTFCVFARKTLPGDEAAALGSP